MEKTKGEAGKICRPNFGDPLFFHSEKMKNRMSPMEILYCSMIVGEALMVMRVKVDGTNPVLTYLLGRVFYVL